MNIKDFQNSLDYIFEAQLSAFIWGHAGIGKTSIVKQYAKQKNWHFFPLYLGTQADLGDILGLAMEVRDKDGTPIATKFAPPEWIVNTIKYCEENPDSGAIIFLDEFNRARRDVLQGMFSLALDKTFHTIKLPKNCHIIAAGNPPTDEYHVTDVDETALMSRFLHIKLEPTLQEWVHFAKNTETEATLISFIQEQPGMLEDSRTGFELPIKVDRRSYERLDRLFKLKTPTLILEQLMPGIIGLERTVAYQLHCKKQESALTSLQIFKGEGFERLAAWSEPGDIKASLLNASSDNLVEAITAHDKAGTKLTEEEQENMVRFLETMPKDIAYVTMTKLIIVNYFLTIAAHGSKLEPRVVKIARIAKGLE